MHPRVPYLIKFNESKKDLVFKNVKISDVEFEQTDMNELMEVASISFENVTLSNAGFSGINDFSKIKFKNVKFDNVDILGSRDINSIEEKLNGLSHSAKTDSDKKELRKVLVAEIINLSRAMKRQDALDFLKKATSPNLTIFSHRHLSGKFISSIADYDTGCEKTLKDEINMLNCMTDEEVSEARYSDNLDVICFSMKEFEKEEIDDRAFIVDDNPVDDLFNSVLHRIDDVLNHLTKKDILMSWNEGSKNYIFERVGSLFRKNRTISRSFSADEKIMNPLSLLSIGLQKLGNSNDYFSQKNYIINRLFRIDVKNQDIMAKKLIEKIESELSAKLCGPSNKPSNHIPETNSKKF